MRDRFELLRKLLTPSGVFFLHLDQEEVHYAKVLLDEVFSRANFLGQVAYERSGVSGIGQGGAFLVNTHEYVLAYARDKTVFEVRDNRGAVPLELKDMKRYNRILRSPGNRKEIARFIAPSTGQPVVIYQHTDFEIESISLRDAELRKEVIQRLYVENFKNVFRNTSVQTENEFQHQYTRMRNEPKALKEDAMIDSLAGAIKATAHALSTDPASGSQRIRQDAITNERKRLESQLQKMRTLPGGSFW
jgi:adenine-specific DNA-methyltransferase